jgi:hypothetical protein
MSEHFGQEHADQLISTALKGMAFEEQSPAPGKAHREYPGVADPGEIAGWLRLWHAPRDTGADRMVHFRLRGGPVDTHLLFLFGRADSTVPHFHAQVVQFAPDACVFNADLLPRLDAVEHPDYFRQVFMPLNKPYWAAINDYRHICSHAPGNPAIAVYLSPWSIACSRPTNGAELAAVTPSIMAYLDHWLSEAMAPGYPAPPGTDLRQRDGRHMASFMDESLDPRAWKGVYRAIGTEAGHEIRRTISSPVY